MKRQARRKTKKDCLAASSAIQCQFDPICISLNIHMLGAAALLAIQEYVKRVPKKNGSMGWQGGKHLADSAMWTAKFCHTLLMCWEESRAELGLSNGPAREIIRVELD